MAVVESNGVSSNNQVESNGVEHSDSAIVLSGSNDNNINNDNNQSIHDENGGLRNGNGGYNHHEHHGDEGFKKEMRDLEDILSKLNPMAEEFVRPSLSNNGYNGGVLYSPAAAAAAAGGGNINGGSNGRCCFFKSGGLSVITRNLGSSPGNPWQHSYIYSHLSTGASLPPPFPPSTLRKALACYVNVLSSPNKNASPPTNTFVYVVSPHGLFRNCKLDPLPLIG